jgi:hypothetical protein
MLPGTRQEAKELALQRWAGMHRFDLEPEVWDSIFESHNPADVLQAIADTKHTRSRQPSVVYERLLFCLESLATRRAA